MDWKERENRILAPYAVYAAESGGRRHEESDDKYRSPFQRDRDRIVHCQAFRRLEYKTQVFVNHEGDHYRTRLTHTLEATQIARTISRSLQLNEDLTEAIALAHDLGHTPFGHTGEESLNRLMRGHGGFEHNRQSLRIVEELEEKYSGFKGLNLSIEVRGGMMKHTTYWDRGDKRGKGKSSLEAQVVNLADEIAYNSHDIDDGLASGLITFDQLSKLALWQEVVQGPPSPEGRLPDKLRKERAVRLLINRQVTDLVENSAQRLYRLSDRSQVEVRRRGKSIINFSPRLKNQLKLLSRFLFDNLYCHYRVKRLAEKHDRFLKEIFALYTKRPDIMPPKFSSLAKKTNRYRAACDYIAGMTDRYALKEYEKLFAPLESV